MSKIILLHEYQRKLVSSCMALVGDISVTGGRNTGKAMVLSMVRYYAKNSLSDVIILDECRPMKRIVDDVRGELEPMITRLVAMHTDEILRNHMRDPGRFEREAEATFGYHRTMFVTDAIRELIPA